MTKIKYKYEEDLGNNALSYFVICPLRGSSELLSKTASVSRHEVQSRKDVLPLAPSLFVSLKHVE